MLRHLISRLVARNQANSAMRKRVGSNLYPKFGETDVPFFVVVPKPHGQSGLYFCMIQFAHVSLLQLSVNIIAIRTVAAVQILAQP